MREIRTLRARWRELETEPRTRLHGHEGGNPGYSQADVLTGHRASSRPYIGIALTIRQPKVAHGPSEQLEPLPRQLCGRKKDHFVTSVVRDSNPGTVSFLQPF